MNATDSACLKLLHLYLEQKNQSHLKAWLGGLPLTFGYSPEISDDR